MDLSSDEDDYADPRQMLDAPRLATFDDDDEDSDDPDWDMDDPRDEFSESEDELLYEDELFGDELEAELQELRSPCELIGKEGTVWKFEPPPPSRRPTSNKIVKVPGLTASSRNVRSFVDAFDLFISKKIIDMIIKYTNKKAKSVYLNENREWEDIDEIELRAFIGLLYFSGVNQDRHQSITSMWKSKGASARPVYSGVMSRNRFRQIARFIRFDDHTTTQERRKTNRYEPIREMTETFIANVKKHYNPSAQLCIDEQLMPFNGKCGFRVFMKSKPDKEGLKWWLGCDVATQYIFNLQLYLGKLSEQPEKCQGQRVVLDLVHHLGPGYGVTGDSFFSTVELCKCLHEKKMTYLGTMNNQRVDVPELMKKHKSRPQFESRFLYSENCTMTSWVPKANKAVVVISSQHFDPLLKLNEDNTSDDEPTKKLKAYQRKDKKKKWKKNKAETTKKPLMIHHYNRTKSAVDSADKMTKWYTTRRSTYRWTLASFFNLLDIAGINGTVIYCLNNPNSKIITKSYNYRFKFIEYLAYELVFPYVKRRKYSIPNLSNRIKFNMSLVLEMEEDIHQASGTTTRRDKLQTTARSKSGPPKKKSRTSQDRGESVAARQRCYLCKKSGQDKGTKHSNVCESCLKVFCPKHITVKTTKVCLDC